LASFRGIERALRWCGGRAFYRRAFLSERRLVVREEDVSVRGLPRGLEGFVIAQLSDLHAGPFLRGGDLADVIRSVERARPDLIVITGDFITHHWSEALLVLDDLARLSAPHGVFAVFGNHDYKDRLEGRIVEAYAARGVRFLRNAGARIETHAGALCLVGLEDLEESKLVDLRAARAGVRPGDVEIVLCHNPSAARLLARSGCVAILSGHTHGMQIDLPWLRTFGPKHPGLRVDFDACALIVSRGLGAVGMPLRVGAPAELVLIRLSRAQGASDER
jgi:uncharacterized protein